MKKTKLLLSVFVAGVLHFNAGAQWAITAPTYTDPTTTTTEYTSGPAQIGVSSSSSTVTTPTTKLIVQEDNPVIQLSDVTGSNSTTSVGLNLTIPTASYTLGTYFSSALGPCLSLAHSDGTAGFHIYNSAFFIGNRDGSTSLPLNITSSQTTIYGNATVAGSAIIEGGTLTIGNVFTPAGYKLYVQTGILTEKVKVAVSTTSNWSDYVFNKDYKLLSLGEVETYIKKNKHLPDVPSAEDVVKEGIDVATMGSIGISGGIVLSGINIS